MADCGDAWALTERKHLRSENRVHLSPFLPWKVLSTCRDASFAPAAYWFEIASRRCYTRRGRAYSIDVGDLLPRRPRRDGNE
jgi:hypothetical protein